MDERGDPVEDEPMRLQRLTRRQADTLATLRAFWGEHGYGPTINELAEGLGVSVSTAYEHLVSLENISLVERLDPGKTRSWAPVMEDERG